MEIKKPQIYTLSTSIENRLEAFKHQHPNIKSVLIFEDEIWVVNFTLELSGGYLPTSKCFLDIVISCDIVEFRNSKLYEWLEQHITYRNSEIYELNYATELKKTIKIVNLLDENETIILQNALIIPINTTHLDIAINFRQTTRIIECELLADWIYFQPNVNS